MWLSRALYVICKAFWGNERDLGKTNIDAIIN